MFPTVAMRNRHIFFFLPETVGTKTLQAFKKKGACGAVVQGGVESNPLEPRQSGSPHLSLTEQEAGYL